MNVKFLLLPATLVFLFAIVVGVAPVTGKTLGENPAAADIFGASWSQPGPITIGLASITRTSRPAQRDGLVAFADLRNRQELTLNISALLGIDIAYSAGGPTLSSTSAILLREGVHSAATFFRSYWRPNPKLGVQLEVTLRGAIKLTLDIGKRPIPQIVRIPEQTYRPIVVTAAAPPPAVVPLPLPVAALASGLGALLMLKRRRRRAI